MNKVPALFGGAIKADSSGGAARGSPTCGALRHLGACFSTFSVKPPCRSQTMRRGVRSAEAPILICHMIVIERASEFAGARQIP